VTQRLGRGIALLFRNRGTRRGWAVSSTPRPHFTPGKDPVPIVQEAGWAPEPAWTGGKSRPHRDSIPDRPARSQSLYRQSYPAHRNMLSWLKLWIKLLLLHLVGCLYYCISDTRSHKHQTSSLTLLPVRWIQQVAPKRRYLSTRLHNAITHTTVFFSKLRHQIPTFLREYTSSHPTDIILSSQCHEKLVCILCLTCLTKVVMSDHQHTT